MNVNNVDLIEFLKPHLKTKKFKTQKEVEAFCNEKNLYPSQSNISKLFKSNMIEKNSLGYYVDLKEEHYKKSISIFFNDNETKISTPMLNTSFISKKGEILKDGLYSIIIHTDGNVEYLYELISNYLYKDKYLYITGKNNIQIMHTSLRKIYRANLLLKKLNR